MPGENIRLFIHLHSKSNQYLLNSVIMNVQWMRQVRVKAGIESRTLESKDTSWQQ